jgi:hypothetical protein
MNHNSKSIGKNSSKSKSNWNTIGISKSNRTNYLNTGIIIKKHKITPVIDNN